MKYIGKLWEATRGASPVVGVILVVGLTIIVAAVLGGAVFGIGDSVGDEPPQTQFNSEQVDGFTVHPTGSRTGQYSYVEFEHVSGDNVNMENVRLDVNGEEAFELTEIVDGNIDEGDEIEVRGDNDPITALDSCGGECHYTFSQNEVLSSGDTVRVVVKEGGEGREGRGFTIEDNGDLVYNGFDVRVSLEDGDEVRLLFESGDSTFTIAEHEVSDPDNIRTN